MSDRDQPLRASDLLTEEDLSTEESSVESVDGEAPVESVLIHFVDDGFTALETMWYRGQELEVQKGTDAWAATCDRNGENSWMLLDDTAQIKRYGRVMFRPGPWPYDDWEDEEAKAKERQRARRPPVARPGAV